MLSGLSSLEGEPAVSIAGSELCYGELREAAFALAARLSGARCAAAWAQPSLEFCVAAVAAVSAGIPLVPLNHRLGRAELDHVLRDSRPDVLIGAPAELLVPDRVSRLGVDLTARRSEPLPVTVAAHDPALIVYTSGTTGPPKGAVISRGAIASNLDAVAEAWEWTDADVLTHALPLFHVHGLVLGLFGPLRRGGALRHLGDFTPTAAAEAVHNGATMMFGVPTMYHRIANQAESDRSIGQRLRGARVLVSGSAALPAPDFERIERLTGHRLVERYGMTETLMNLAVRTDGERRPGRVGIAVPGVEVKLVEDDGSELHLWDGESIGEILVRGPNLFSGYLNRPEATTAAMRDGWFQTGDLASRDPDGYWRIVGRRSTDLIKTGGYKVGAADVELALLGHPLVREAAVTGEPDADLGERIIAWVVTDDARVGLERELINHVANELAAYKRPREVRFLQELPRNALGKVVKQQLRR